MFKSIIKTLKLYRNIFIFLFYPLRLLSTNNNGKKYSFVFLYQINTQVLDRICRSSDIQPIYLINKILINLNDIKYFISEQPDIPLCFYLTLKQRYHYLKEYKDNSSFLQEDSIKEYLCDILKYNAKIVISKQLYYMEVAKNLQELEALKEFMDEAYGLTNNYQLITLSIKDFPLTYEQVERVYQNVRSELLKNETP